MNRQEAKLVRSGMKAAVEAFHKLGFGGICDLAPEIREAFYLLDEAILDLKESLGYERSGDWKKKELT
jgi:hypothetical protein